MKRTMLLAMTALAIVGLAVAQPTAAIADKPAILTSVGQSADLEMVKVLMTRSRLPFSTNETIQASALPVDAKTLVVVVGGSSKGLGAAGISAEQEAARARAVLARAKELGMKVITLHIGGEARRGALSDGLIELCIGYSDLVIAVAEGNKDDLFGKQAAKAKIGLVLVDKITGAQAPLAAAFR